MAASRAQGPIPAAELIGPCLEKLKDAASGRKYQKLREDVKVIQ